MRILASPQPEHVHREACATTEQRRTEPVVAIQQRDGPVRVADAPRPIRAVEEISSSKMSSFMLAGVCMYHWRAAGRMTSCLVETGRSLRVEEPAVVATLRPR